MSSSLIPWSSGSAREALVCIPWAGAGAGPFRPWAVWLAPELDVWAVRFPGRESRIRERPLESMEALVQDLAEPLSLFGDVEFALFGHCSGALIAFELARELRRRGAPAPQALLVASCAAPALRGGVETRSPQTGDPRHYLRSLGLTSEEVLADDELFELLRPSLEADLSIAEGYVYRVGEPFNMPITAFHGAADEHLQPSQLSGWSRETTAAFRLVELDGDYLFSGDAWHCLALEVSAAARRTA